MSRIAAGVLTLSLVLAPMSASSQMFGIDFEGTGAPCIFQKTSPLTTYYSHLGLTMAGNGSILNECANFGVDARSGTDYWAFNDLIAPTLPTIDFHVPAYSFSIWVASGFQPAVFTLAAYTGGGHLVAWDAVATNKNEWQQLSITGQGIKQIIIGAGDNAFVLDDMQVGVVPEPSTIILLGTGLLGLGVVAVRRRREEEE